MRKRKPPIALITVLLIAGVVALGFNYQSGINPKAQAEQKTETPSEAQVGKPRAQQSSKDIANAVKQQGGDAMATAAPAKPRHKEGPMKGPMSKFASIEMPPEMNNKPKPSGSSPSGQWYDANSGQ